MITILLCLLGVVVLCFAVSMYLGFLNIKRYAELYDVDYEQAARELAERARQRKRI